MHLTSETGLRCQALLQKFITRYTEELAAMQDLLLKEGKPALPPVMATPTKKQRAGELTTPTKQVVVRISEKTTPNSFPIARHRKVICLKVKATNDGIAVFMRGRPQKLKKQKRVNWIRQYNGANPLFIRYKKVVHHRLERGGALDYYPSLFHFREIHHVKNLTGIPAAKNRWLHLTFIRQAYNWVYFHLPYATRRHFILAKRVIDSCIGEHLMPQNKLATPQVRDVTRDEFFIPSWPEAPTPLKARRRAALDQLQSPAPSLPPSPPKKASRKAPTSQSQPVKRDLFPQFEAMASPKPSTKRLLNAPREPRPSKKRCSGPTPQQLSIFVERR